MSAEKPKRTRRPKLHDPARGPDGHGPWIVEAMEKTENRFGVGCSPKLAHYSKAYALSVAMHFHQKFGRYPDSEELREILGYTQVHKPRILFYKLEEEGYVRCQRKPNFAILEILKHPYFVPRPELRCIEHGEPEIDRLESLCAAFEERKNEENRRS